MLRALLIVAACAAVAAPAAANGAKKVKLLPGLTYERVVRPAPGGTIVAHVVIGPKPGGLWELRPVLANDRIKGRETVSGMQERLAPSATAVGVNGDLFNFKTGHPSGILLRDGVLDSRPLFGRSSLGIGFDGLLRIARINFFGTFTIGSGEKRPMLGFNRPLEPNTMGLFLPSWGKRTPREAGAVDVILSEVPAALPNAELTGVVVGVRRGGGTRIPPGGAVLQGNGFWTDRLQADATVGASFAATLKLKPWWQNVRDAIGGGPVIVRRGKVVKVHNEAFTDEQLSPRNPRTAVGQRADGRIILLAIDGRQKASVGVTVPTLAKEMVRLGAETAMALDAGGSTTVAFDGEVLNVPSDGRERPVGNSLMLLYHGVYAPPPRHPVISPNGDGFTEFQELEYKLVRPAEVDAKLYAPDGSVFWEELGPKPAGTYPLRIAQAEGQPPLPEGRWRFVVIGTDEQGSRSGFERQFSVNNAVRSIKLSRRNVSLHRERGGQLRVRYVLERAARVRVTIQRRDGTMVRSFRAKRLGAGVHREVWNGKVKGGAVARPGRYRVMVRTKSQFGQAEVYGDVIVKRRGAKRQAALAPSSQARAQGDPPRATAAA